MEFFFITSNREGVKRKGLQSIQRGGHEHRAEGTVFALRIFTYQNPAEDKFGHHGGHNGKGENGKQRILNGAEICLAYVGVNIQYVGIFKGAGKGTKGDFDKCIAEHDDKQCQNAKADAIRLGKMHG